MKIQEQEVEQELVREEKEKSYPSFPSVDFQFFKMTFLVFLCHKALIDFYEVSPNFNSRLKLGLKPDLLWMNFQTLSKAIHSLGLFYHQIVMNFQVQFNERDHILLIFIRQHLIPGQILDKICCGFNMLCLQKVMLSPIATVMLKFEGF